MFVAGTFNIFFILHKWWWWNFAYLNSINENVHIFVRCLRRSNVQRFSHKDFSLILHFFGRSFSELIVSYVTNNINCTQPLSVFFRSRFLKWTPLICLLTAHRSHSTQNTVHRTQIKLSNKQRGNRIFFMYFLLLTFYCTIFLIFFFCLFIQFWIFYRRFIYILFQLVYSRSWFTMHI